MALDVRLIKPPLGPKSDARESGGKYFVSDVDVVLQAGDGKLAGTWHRLGGALPAGATGDGNTLTFRMAEGNDGTYVFISEDQTASQAQEVDRIQNAPGRGLGRALRNAGLALLSLAALVGLYGWIFWWRGRPGWSSDITWRAYYFAALSVVLALTIIHFLTRRLGDSDRGLSMLFVGADRRASTSKTQLMLWTLFIAFALAYVSAWVLLEPRAGGFSCGTATQETQTPAGTTASDHNCVEDASWGAYVLLLGLPAGAAVVAKSVTSYKVENGTLQKTTASDPSLADIASNDSGNADIVDVQYLIFNVVTLAYVAVAFFHSGRLGAVPSILLGLTGTSAATYSLNKSLQTNIPKITSVAPRAIASGQRVVVAGVNLFPDSSGTVQGVSIGDHPAAIESCNSAAGTVIVIAPPGLAAGATEVRVRTAANIETEPYSATAVALGIIGHSPATPAPGKSVQLRLDGIPSAWDAVSATVDGIDAGTPDVNGPTVTITVPDGVEAGVRPTVVAFNGQATPAYNLTVGAG